MPITKNANVQSIESKHVYINLADVATGVDQAAIDLPPNAVVTGGAVVTETAWNSTSTDVISVGDSASYNRYLSAGNFRAAAAFVPLVPTGFIHPGGSITVRWVSGGGTPTTGKSRVRVDYTIIGQATATYG
ncbi:MAG: hypothetical protein H6953_19090 [Chromatiaceae bacterium]|nr:hypothetical protein [Chromatiaceae bacterium]